MLKKIKNISLFLACMVLMLHTIVPHHHHNNTTTLCLSQLSHNECEDNNICTSEHDHESDNDCDESNCTIDDLYTPKDNQETKVNTYINLSLFDCYLISIHKFSLNNILKNKGVKLRRVLAPLIYHNPHVNSIFGLRAPPF